MKLLITLALGLFFLLGALIIRQSHRHADTIETASIAIALGAMVALGLFDMLPELLEDAFEQQSVMIHVLIDAAAVAAGFFILLGLDRFIPEHEVEDDSQEHRDENAIHVGVMASIAIVLHNILEGMAVYSMSEADLMSGLAFGLGIGLHNIPMGMFIYTTMKHDRRHVKYPVFFAATLSTFFGGLIMATISAFVSASLEHILIGVALGMLCYIVFMELIPFARQAAIRAKNTTIIGFITGCAIVLLSLAIG